ncbi:MAG: diguanylate cyclase [Betaproteobacteria bacterium]
MKRESRFRLKIYVVLAAMVIITLLTSLSLSYYFSYDHQMKQLRIQMLQTVEDKAGYMGEWLKGKIAILDVFDQMRRRGERPSINAETLLKHGITDIYEGNCDGAFRSYTGWTPPAGYDPRIRPWYKDIFKQGALSISDPYLDLNTGKMTVTLGRPVAEKQGKDYILAADIPIQTIAEQITRLNFSDMGFVWILNERGAFVFHPDPQVIYQNIRQVEDVAGVPENARLSPPGEVRYQHQGAWHTAIFWNIPNSQWLLGVTVPDSSAFKNLERLRDIYLGLSVMLTALFAVLVYFMTRILSAPLIRIIDFVRQVTAGNLDQQLSIHFSRELDSLAASLNEMSERLKRNFSQIEAQKAELSRYNQELELQVQERTKDLQVAYIQLEEAYEKTKCVAATDYLTGIANRRSFFELAANEVSRSARDGTPLCLLEVDLDDFKKVNDTFGHAAGDKVLIHAVRQIQQCLRNYDLLGRLGGEEFAIMLPNTPFDQGKLIGKRIQEAVVASLVEHEEHLISVSISVGFAFRAVCVDDVDDVETVLCEADRALYVAKELGKNRLVAFSELA